MLKCMSWNILLQRWYERDKKNDKNFMVWSDRRELILDKIRSFDCDIVCLQEVDLATATSDFESLTDVYDYVVHEITKKRNSIMGNMILWKKSMFDLIDVDLRAYAIHATMKHKETKEIIWLSNVHLKSGLQSGEEQRIQQFNSCLNVWMKNKHKACICGDFNDNFMKDGLLLRRINEFNDTLNKDGLSSKIFKYMGPPTCYGVEILSPLDHVTSSDVNPWYDPIDQKYEPFDKYLIVKIPNRDMPSDHYPIRFSLKL